MKKILKKFTKKNEIINNKKLRNQREIKDETEIIISHGVFFRYYIL